MPRPLDPQSRVSPTLRSTRRIGRPASISTCMTSARSKARIRRTRAAGFAAGARWHRLAGVHARRIARESWRPAGLVQGGCRRARSFLARCQEHRSGVHAPLERQDSGAGQLTKWRLRLQASPAIRRKRSYPLAIAAGITLDRGGARLPGDCVLVTGGLGMIASVHGSESDSNAAPPPRRPGRVPAPWK